MFSGFGKSAYSNNHKVTPKLDILYIRKQHFFTIRAALNRNHNKNKKPRSFFKSSSEFPAVAASSAAGVLVVWLRVFIGFMMKPMKKMLSDFLWIQRRHKKRKRRYVLLVWRLKNKWEEEIEEMDVCWCFYQFAVQIAKTRAPVL